MPTEKEGGVCPSRCGKYEIVPACSSYSACWAIVAFSVFQWDFKKWCLFGVWPTRYATLVTVLVQEKNGFLSLVWSPGNFHPAEVAGVLVADGQFQIQFYRCNFSETTELGQLLGFACSGSSRAGQFSFLFRCVSLAPSSVRGRSPAAGQMVSFLPLGLPLSCASVSHCLASSESKMRLLVKSALLWKCSGWYTLTLQGSWIASNLVISVTFIFYS